MLGAGAASVLVPDVAAARVCLIPEGPEGARNFAAIAAVPSAGTALLGPFDLTVAMGYGGGCRSHVIEPRAATAERATAGRR
ncbi:MAG: hypothetical protein M3O34_02180 [Chloroflexota bacterium]|nr:hypothetical protein [Chloroflexota bacterium]